MWKFTKNFFTIMLSLLVVCCCSAFTLTTVPDVNTDTVTKQLPILMYHKVATKNPAKYVVTTQQLADDWAALSAAGYRPVFMQEVIDWVNGQGELPAKPIVITFDDGQYNNLYYGLPLAQKYGIKFLINPVTAYSEKSIADHDTTNPRYSNLDWDTIKQGYDSGLVEYGNHSHNLHRTGNPYGVAPKRHEAPTAYAERLRGDISHAQELLTACGVPAPTTFAYPFGKYTPATRDLLLDMGFQALLTCNEHTNTITRGDPSCLHALGRFNRSGNLTTAQLMKKIEG